MTARAGWYADPGRSGRLRYWDGSRWTDRTTPETDAVRARAEQQHRWVLEGDPRGIYGEQFTRLAPGWMPIGGAAKVAQIAHTKDDLETLLTDRPPLWSGAAFVSVMIQRRDAEAGRLRSARLGYGDPRITNYAVRAEYSLRFKYDDLIQILTQLTDLMRTPTFQLMFGQTEADADGDAIVLAANRIMDHHEAVLDLAESNRRMNVTYDLYWLQSMLAKAFIDVLGAFDAFIDANAARLARLEEVVRYGGSTASDRPVVFHAWVDPKLGQALNAALPGY